ncbi:DcaP family trimeric outer membrane transporter [Sphingomonas sp. HT-1]|uniref:DcaP family trimeric outer membrane transporter n=1 Tax=unclassified Sphingomonas TaxID=196159 RepID=UPI0002F6035D|nr:MULTISPECIES: DcaP family trimeric outer membrane transporter [unclassified Sphingomonas]KTF68246.1 hypothetical protein ATB93_14640 [Sphingomonas sp. WG]
MQGWKLALLAGTAAAGLSPAAAIAQSSREAALEARLRELEQAVSELRGELRSARAEQVRTAAAAEQSSQAVAAATQASVATEKRVAALETAPPRDGFRMGGSTVKLSGFVRLNAIATRYNDGEIPTGGLGKEFYLPQQIPVGGGYSSRDMLLSARQTRLAVTATTPMNGTDIKTHIEFDFALATAPVGAQRATNPYVPTFRRGFIEYGRWLVGQEWSTFQNVAVLPESTDFVGPLEGTVFNRQGLIRYTTPLRGGSNFQIAIENPQTETALPSAAALVDNDHERLPDLVARVNWKTRLGDFSLAGIARELHAEVGGVGDSAVGWGVSGAGRVPIGTRHDVRFMATYGQGIGRYLGLGYVPDALFGGTATRMARIDNFAAFAALKLGWTNNLRSTFTGSYQTAQYPDRLAVTLLANKAAWSAAANLFWTPVKGMDVGIEYRHGQRELVSGDSGALDRIEMAFKYGF